MILEFKDGKALKLDNVVSIKFESENLMVFLKGREKPFPFIREAVKGITFY